MAIVGLLSDAVVTMFGKSMESQVVVVPSAMLCAESPGALGTAMIVLTVLPSRNLVDFARRSCRRCCRVFSAAMAIAACHRPKAFITFRTRERRSPPIVLNCCHGPAYRAFR